jgi:3D (Asp-Asp-Asp) domain-containing protein
MVLCEPVRLAIAAAVLAVALGSPAVSADDSKLDKEAFTVSAKNTRLGKGKVCCGYPLSEELGFALRFYWLAMQNGDVMDDADEIEVYTRQGLYLGTYGTRFIAALRMEGSGWLDDGRVINYDGSCRWGAGTCFEQLDEKLHPYGRGAGQRPLVPFRSVAVDPRLVPIGEPLYIPELDGILLPDGSIHDGCVRADDTGGGIKHRKMDFFVVSYDNFRFIDSELWYVNWITPHIEDPRCQWLADET